MAAKHDDATRIQRIARKWKLTGIGWVAVIVGGILLALTAGVLWLAGVPIAEAPLWVSVILTVWGAVAVVGLGMILFFEPLRSEKYLYATTRHFEDQQEAATKTFDPSLGESDHFLWDEQIAELSDCSREELIGRLLALRERGKRWSYISGPRYWAGLLEQLPNRVFTENADIIMGAMREIQRKLRGPSSPATPPPPADHPDNPV